MGKAGRRGKLLWRPKWEVTNPHRGLYVVQGHEMREVRPTHKWYLHCPHLHPAPEQQDYLGRTLYDAVEMLGDHMDECEEATRMAELSSASS